MYKLPERSANRLKDCDYDLPGVYFVTICTNNKEHILWSSSSVQPVSYTLSTPGNAVSGCINEIEHRYPGVKLHSYAIMPNHVHLLLELPEQEKHYKLPTIIRGLKSAVSKSLNDKIWQKGYYDHIIRNETDYNNTLHYINANPEKWILGDMFDE